jgi:hypothetical protein
MWASPVSDIVDDLEVEGSPLSMRAARYIRIKRQTEEGMQAQHKRDLKRLYELGRDRSVSPSWGLPEKPARS